jgi:uncharacterized repeat protein (TIGR03803 family)
MSAIPKRDMQMQQKTFASTLCKAMLIVLWILGATIGVRATSTEKLIYSFGPIDNNGDNPEGGLVFDKAGNLYGTTFGGGTNGRGTIYELTRTSSGWTGITLYNFCPDRVNCADGWSPIGSLIIDTTGNLFGTTYFGGNNGCSCGVVFELSPGADGWTQTVLYAFSGGDDGAKPIAGLVADSAGDLYGTTIEGGTGKKCTTGLVPGCGVVFQLAKNPSGEWTETVLHSFRGGKDGDGPAARLTLDGTGVIYGTTAGSAPDDPGTVFKLVNTKTGWKETVLYRFAGKADGNSPEADVVLDENGAVYGTTRYGGTGKCSEYGYHGCGVVFKLEHSKTGWTESVIHSFNGGSSDGSNPAAGLVIDAKGNLYGTTAEGGLTGFCGDNGCGTVFRLTPAAGGKWNKTLLHRFDDSIGDGAYPLGDVILDGAGNIYSTTQYGGSQSEGAAFEVLR